MAAAPEAEKSPNSVASHQAREEASKLSHMPSRLMRMNTVPGRTSNRPPRRSSSVPNAGISNAWTMLPGSRMSPVTVADSMSTCWAYMGMSSSMPRNRKMLLASTMTA